MESYASQNEYQIQERAVDAMDTAKKLWKNREKPDVQRTVADNTRVLLRIGTAATTMMFALPFVAIGTVAGYVAAQLKDFDLVANYIDSFKDSFDNLRHNAMEPTTQLLVDSVILLASWTMPMVTGFTIGLRAGTALDKTLDSWVNSSS